MHSHVKRPQGVWETRWTETPKLCSNYALRAFEDTCKNAKGVDESISAVPGSNGGEPVGGKALVANLLGYMKLAYGAFQIGDTNPKDYPSDISVTEVTKKRALYRLATMQKRTRAGLVTVVKDIVKDPAPWTPFYYLRTTSSELQVVTRGSKLPRDWVTDASVLTLKKHSFHPGFKRMAETILFAEGHHVWLQWVLPALQAGKNVVFVGHSLAAAVSAYLLIVCLELVGPWSTLGKNLHAYTYGSPPVVPKCFEYLVATHCHNVVHQNDLVSHARYDKDLVIPGGDSVFHLVKCKNARYVMMRRSADSFLYKRSAVRDDHKMKLYIAALQDVLSQVPSKNE